jgi:hypothetical protein
VVSRLRLPNLVQDEGILLVTVRETEVAEWISDVRYREIMQSMITVADVGGPQEFILGGAVVQLDDFERFIPGGMGEWFRRRILDKRTRTASPESLNARDASAASSSPSLERPRRGMQGDVLRRLQHAMQILEEVPNPDEEPQNAEEDGTGGAGENPEGNADCRTQ